MVGFVVEGGGRPDVHGERGPTPDGVRGSEWYTGRARGAEVGELVTCCRFLAFLSLSLAERKRPDALRRSGGSAGRGWGARRGAIAKATGASARG